MRVLWLFFASTVTTKALGASVDERAILLELYEATGGHAWNENFGWAENEFDICSWHGVICDGDDLEHAARRTKENSDGVVLGLKLDKNFVTGRTPSSLWKLPSLVYADFSRNPHLDVNFVGLDQNNSTSPLKTVKVRDTGTTSIVGLSFASETLEVLEMSQNAFNSQIPNDLYSLTRLTSLHAAESGLLGSLPDDIHRLSMLEELNLYNNGLTGTIPDDFSRLTRLRHLTLSHNQFHGALPDYFSDFLMLNQLWAINNDFTGPIPSLSRSPEIHDVHLNGNSFSGDIPGDFLAATLNGSGNQINVNLANNELEGIVPESLNNLKELSITWTLGNNKWTEISDSLCYNSNWNQGSVATFGCYGLMCPPRTFNAKGYETESSVCEPCMSSEYWGATTCFDKDDRSVLVELFVALGGEKWDDNENWTKEDDFCTWYGITCWDMGDIKDGRVRKIELPNNNLRGTVPETIYSVQHLTTVDLSRNDVVMAFNNIQESMHIFSINVARTNTKDFDGIENANPFFRQLYADQTPLSGTIPREIYGIQNLEVLSLQECGLSGEIEDGLFGVASLRELHLSNNDFAGNLPDRWDELKKLEILSLAKNQLKGPLPDSIDSAANLKAVSLQDQVTKGGGLTGTVHPYSKSRKLRTLLLGSNKLEGDIPEDLLANIEGEMPVTIDLSNNFVTGKIHGTFARFKRLDLYVDNNLITEVEDDLCDQSEWMSGAVGAFGCDAILCPAGTKGGRRQYVDSVCDVCDERKTSYLGQASCGKDLENLTERDILEILYDQMGGVGWNEQEFWKTQESVCEWYGIACDENGSVISIQLGGNELAGSFPTEIYLLPNLNHLKLHSNTVYFSFEGIENAKSLETLSLDDTGLDSMDGIGKARSLVEIHVSHNKLSGAIPEELSRLVNLKTFDASHNNLGGFLPYWLRSLASLTTFSASYNELSGPVHDFSHLRHLIILDLSHNELTGPVPATLFGSVADDEKVFADLSFNKLSGTVPGDLSRLNRLSLQVEANHISSVDDELCRIDGWNDFDVQRFGCDGFLCPIGSWNNLGRQSHEDAPCTPCKSAKYMGTTNCKSGATVRTLGLWAAVLVSWILLV